MNKLKVAIAGFGIVGKRRFHYINQHPSLKVTAICEQHSFEKGLEYSGINCYTNYQDLLDKEELDIIFVCLTNNIA
ncbi:MAG: Gfo/Idh/MocA family oxidoreductase, partial [Flavobacteriales bacterium]|nr:Gfo/Idh/MocA family oxidoreductase [Flavobacteriales bacterium]